MTITDKILKLWKKQSNIEDKKLPSGGPSIMAPLEEQINELLISLNTGLGALFFGDKNSGKDFKTVVNAYKSHATTTILGKRDSIYYELQQTNTKLDKSRGILHHISNDISSIKQYIEESLIGSDNTSDAQYEGVVKFLIEGIDDKTIDKLNELFVLADKDNEKLFMTLSNLYNSLNMLSANKLDLTNLKLIETSFNDINSLYKKINNLNFDLNNVEKIDNLNNFLFGNNDQKGLQQLFDNISSLEIPKSNNIKKTFSDASEILFVFTAITPILQSIWLNDKITPKIATVRNFSEKIGILFDTVNGLTISEPENIKKLNKTISFLGTLMLKLPLIAFAVSKINKSNAIENIYKFIGHKNYKFPSLYKIFGNLSELSKRSVNEKNVYASLEAIRNIIYTLKGISKVYNDDIIPTHVFIYDFNRLLDTSINDGGQLNKLFNNINDLSLVKSNKKEIDNNINILRSLVISLASIFSLYNHASTLQNVTDFSALLNASKGQSLFKVFEKITKLSDNKYKTSSSGLLKTITNLSGIISALQKLSFSNNIFENTGVLYSLFGDSKSDQNINKNLQGIFDGIKTLDIPEKSIFENLNLTVGCIASTISSLNEISKNASDPKKLKSLISDYIDLLKESYEEIKETFENIADLEPLANKVNNINSQFQKANEGLIKTASETNNNSKQIKGGNLSLKELSIFMITSTAILTIGAMIIEADNGQFIENALKFGVVLGLFEAAVIAPTLMFAALKGVAFPSLKDFSFFVITCTFTMLLGAAFITLGGGRLVKSSLLFGVSLALFETLVVSPLLMFAALKGVVFPSLKGFSLFIITCTFTMLLGAAFITLGGGKYLEAAFMFGLALAKFEALVIAPFILFRFTAREVFPALKDFTKFILVSTFCLLLGGVFARNEKYVAGAFAFTGILAAFEIAVITPFILFRFVSKLVFPALKDFTKFILTSTFCLLLGAVFMRNKNFVIGAFGFAGLLAAFEAAVIAPFILFRFVSNRAFKSLRDFTKFILVSTFCLLLGAVFMKKDKFWLQALQFTVLLAVFEAAAIAPFLLFSLVDRKVNSSLREFTLFIMGATFCLLLGAIFMKKYSALEVIGYAFILWAFTTAMTFTACMIKNVFNDKKAIMAIESFSMFVLLSSAALSIGALFVAMFGWEPVAQYAIILTIFVGAMGFVFFLLSKFIRKKSILQMESFALFILISSAALSIGALFVATFGIEPVALYAVCLTGFIIAMGIVFGLLGLMSPIIGPGVLVAGAISVVMLLMTGAFFIVNEFFKSDKGGKQLQENITVLQDIVTGPLVNLFKSIADPLLLIAVAFGSATASAMGLGLLTLGSSLGLINLIIGKHGEELKTNILILNELIENNLAKTFSILGGLSLLIVIGSASAVAMSAALLLLGGSLRLVNVIIGNNAGKIKQNIKDLQDSVVDLSKLFLAINANINLLDLIESSIKISSLSKNIIQLSSTLLSISSAMEAIKKSGDISQYKQAVINNIKAFLEILNNKEISTDSIGDFKKKIKEITGICIPMAKMMAKLSESVQDMAEMKIPIGWDSDGKVTGYRHLKDKDFELMTENVGKVITSMTSAIMKAYNQQFVCGESTTSLAELVKDRKVLKNVIKFNKELGNIIANIAKGVADMANLVIATKWDENGKAIDFRHLKEKDFDAAADNTKIIITTLSEALISIYNENEDMFKESGGNLLKKGESPFAKVLKVSMDISSLIGNIGESVAHIANLTVPTEWDPKTGKPSKFRTLTNKDFTDAAINVGTIITTVMTALANLYKDGKKLGGGDINIFDMQEKDGVLGWFGLKDPPPIIRVIEASTKISELIANLGEGIQKMATMQIPDQWDPKNGKPIHFRKLTSTDFTDAAESIKQIITLTTQALKGAKDLISDPDDIKEVAEALLPMSQLISNVSEGILKLATAQVPKNWNPETGVPTEFTKVTKDDYNDVTTVVCDLITSLSRSVIDAYLGTDGKPGLKELIEGEDFKNTVEAFNGVGDIVSNIAESVIKIASAQIPDQWNKDGKPIHYKDISDWGKITNDLMDILTKVICCVGFSVIKVYDKNKALFTGENSPFGEAVKGIQGITQIVSGITDSVIKLGTAQIPVEFDEHGKPKRYEKINVDQAVADVKRILSGDAQNEGLLDVLCSSVKTVGDKYFDSSKTETYIGNVLPDITKGLGEILNVVSSVTQVITNIANLKIPTGYNEKGEIAGYKIFDSNEMPALQETITSIITGVFTAVSNAWTNVEQTSPTLISSDGTEPPLIKNISTSIASITELIGSTIEGLSEIISQEESIHKILNYNGTYKDNEESNITLGLFKDIYGILKNINVMSQILNNKNNNIFNTLSTIANSTLLSEENIGNFKEKFKNIGKLISAIITNFNDIYEDIDKNKNVLKNIGKDETLNITGVITNILTLYNDIQNKIKSFNNAFFKDDIKNTIEGTDISIKLATYNVIISGLVNNFNSINETIKNINKLGKISEISNNIFTTIKSIISFYSGSTDISGHTTEGLLQILQNITIEDTFNDKMNEIIKFSQGIGFLSNYLLNNYSNIITTYKNNENTLTEYLNNKDILSTTLITIINDIIKINSSVLTKDIKENNFINLYEFLYSFIRLLGTNENNVIDNISQIIQTIQNNEIIKNYNKNDDLKLSSLLEPVVEDIAKVSVLMSNINNGPSLGFDMSSEQNLLKSTYEFKQSMTDLVEGLYISGTINDELITKLQTNFDKLANIFKIEIPLFGFSRKTNLEIINDPLNDYILITLKFNRDAYSNSTLLSKSIDSIYKVTSSQQGSKKFADNTEILKKYVKTINSLDLRRLNPLVQLAKELNTLANKMGNIDNLTEAIADKLAFVLAELVDKLEESKETIETADKIQQRRYKLIQDSVTTVREIMSKPFNVEISQSGGGSGDLTQGNGGGGDDNNKFDMNKDYSTDELKGLGWTDKEISAVNTDKNDKVTSKELQAARDAGKLPSRYQKTPTTTGS